ncbi:MAG: hypothetical protein IJP17_08110, partial [Clostridia bacterium]|nr:hypothetical protein [Clostridia bacterium]
VSGVIVEIDGVFSSQTPIEEHAYDDGTWQYVELVDERITIRYNRFLPSDSWVAEHIFKLYPDVLEVEEFSDKAVVSGYSSPRIQISSTASAEGCVVEVMLIKTAEYDYVTAIEVPTDIFYDYEFQIDEWYRAQRLVDVQTGLEVINPDAQVSATDENAGDVTTTAVQ